MDRGRDKPAAKHGYRTRQRQHQTTVYRGHPSRRFCWDVYRQIKDLDLTEPEVPEPIEDAYCQASVLVRPQTKNTDWRLERAHHNWGPWAARTKRPLLPRWAPVQPLLAAHASGPRYSATGSADAQRKPAPTSLRACACRSLGKTCSRAREKAGRASAYSSTASATPSCATDAEPTRERIHECP